MVLIAQHFSNEIWITSIYSTALDLKVDKFLNFLKFLKVVTAAQITICPGEPLVFQAGYHPRKRIFKTHPKHVFCRYENRP